MSRRLLFVAGHLSGIVVGAMAVLVFVASRPTTTAPPPTFTPVVYPVDHQALPDGWQRREFNGQPYYVVPLSAE